VTTGWPFPGREKHVIEFLLVITPGSALMFFIFLFIRANATVSVARTGTARAEARLEAAQDASAIASEPRGQR